MSIHIAIHRAYKTALARDWDTIYVLLDVHGTISPSSYSSSSLEFYPEAIKALRKISKFPEVKIILWTSSYPDAVSRFVSSLRSKGIRIDYVNDSPIKNTATGDFTKKPYFSIIIDDKAGFSPSDWPSAVMSFDITRKRNRLDRRKRCTKR